MKVQVINKSTVVSQEDAMAMTAACADQLRNEFAKAWEILPPDIEFSGDDATDPNAYQMVIFDTSDQPGALGYHDNDPQGKPRGFVFAKTTLDNGGNVSTTLSHELCEMVKDPSCSLWTQTTDGNMRAFEMCDAVESDEYDKTVGDKTIKVSNFLLPNYFAAPPMAGPTDYLGKLNGQAAPARTPGGYDIVIDTTGNVSQEFSKHFALLPDWKQRNKSHSGARTARRTARK